MKVTLYKGTRIYQFEGVDGWAFYVVAGLCEEFATFLEATCAVDGLRGDA